MRCRTSLISQCFVPSIKLSSRNILQEWETNKFPDPDLRGSLGIAIANMSFEANVSKSYRRRVYSSKCQFSARKESGLAPCFANVTFSHNDTHKPLSVVNSGLCKGLIRSCHTPPRITGTDATIGRWDASLLNAHRGWLARTLPYHWGVGNTEHGASEGREVEVNIISYGAERR